MTSATDFLTVSMPLRGKDTNTRPDADTATPTTCCSNSATICRSPTLRSTEPSSSLSSNDEAWVRSDDPRWPFSDDPRWPFSFANDAEANSKRPGTTKPSRTTIFFDFLFMTDSYSRRRLDARRTCVGYGSSRGPTSPIWVGTDSHLLLRGDRGGAYRNRALRRTARRRPRPRVVADRGAAMNTRNVVTGFFLVVSVVGQGAIALSRAGESSVTVLARGPAGLRIEGKSSQTDFEEDASALTFKVPIAPIETGIGLRDRHLRETLEADKFPAAILRVSRSELTFPNEDDAAAGTAQGDLTLHGRSRPVQVRYRAERGAAGVTRVHGSVQLDMRDFEIKSPSYLGVSVTPQVEVTVEMAVEGA